MSEDVLDLRLLLDPDIGGNAGSACGGEMKLLSDHDRYESLCGGQPAFELDEHPDGVHVALMVVASPRGNLVAVAWLDLHVGGFELVAIRADGLSQLEGARYSVKPNHISSPAFSPDGRYLVKGWWSSWRDRRRAGGDRRQ